jgi:hypothetical protein
MLVIDSTAVWNAKQPDLVWFFLHIRHNTSSMWASEWKKRCQKESDVEKAV